MRTQPSSPATAVLFADVETVPAYPDFASLPERWKNLWNQKSSLISLGLDPSITYERAGIYAEFGKIICIGTGQLLRNSGKWTLVTRAFYGDNEFELLSEFSDFLAGQLKAEKDLHLCAHNGREFSFPYIARRMAAHAIKVPKILHAGSRFDKSPLIDTMELWKFGDYKHYIGLELLAETLGLQSARQEISGKDVYRTYHIEHNLEKIVNFCLADVEVLSSVYLRLSGESSDRITNTRFLQKSQRG